MSDGSSGQGGTVEQPSAEESVTVSGLFETTEGAHEPANSLAAFAAEEARKVEEAKRQNAREDTRVLTTAFVRRRRRDQILLAVAIAGALGGLALWASLMPGKKEQTQKPAQAAAPVAPAAAQPNDAGLAKAPDEGMVPRPDAGQQPNAVTAAAEPEPVPTTGESPQ